MKKPKKTIKKTGRTKAEMPELFVRISKGLGTEFARANIRVKAGKYLYLAWRDGEHVRNFYLGKKRNA